MLAYCNFYHAEIRILGQVPGEEKLVRKLCEPCKARLEREVEEYVQELAHRNDEASQDFAVSCR